MKREDQFDVLSRFYFKLTNMYFKWNSFTLTSVVICVFLQNVLRISQQNEWWQKATATIIAIEDRPVNKNKFAVVVSPTDKYIFLSYVKMFPQISFCKKVENFRYKWGIFKT